MPAEGLGPSTHSKNEHARETGMHLSTCSQRLAPFRLVLNKAMCMNQGRREGCAPWKLDLASTPWRSACSAEHSSRRGSARAERRPRPLSSSTVPSVSMRMGIATCARRRPMCISSPNRWRASAASRRVGQRGVLRIKLAAIHDSSGAPKCALGLAERQSVPRASPPVTHAPDAAFANMSCWVGVTACTTGHSSPAGGVLAGRLCRMHKGHVTWVCVRRSSSGAGRLVRRVFRGAALALPRFC